jgi:hypothetical protein
LIFLADPRPQLLSFHIFPKMRVEGGTLVLYLVYVPYLLYFLCFLASFFFPVSVSRLLLD